MAHIHLDIPKFLNMQVEEMRRGKALAIMRDWASRHGQLVPLGLSGYSPP